MFKQLEDCEITVDCLTFTKLLKVVRHMGNKTEIPREEEFRFQERARALTEQWSRFLTASYGDRKKSHSSLDSGDMNVDIPIIRDILRVRGLKEVTVVNASGRATSVTLTVT